MQIPVGMPASASLRMARKRFSAGWRQVLHLADTLVVCRSGRADDRECHHSARHRVDRLDQLQVAQHQGRAL